MRLAPPLLLPLLLTAALAACGSPKDEPAADGTASEAAVATAQAPAAAADGKPATFAQCIACHSVEPGKHGIGPSLAGAFGSKAGAVAGFNYSPALKEAGLTWDEATLDQWLAGPMAMVPGTRMSYAGMSDAAKRKELIEYLKTLK